MKVAEVAPSRSCLANVAAVSSLYYIQLVRALGRSWTCTHPKLTRIPVFSEGVFPLNQKRQGFLEERGCPTHGEQFTRAPLFCSLLQLLKPSLAIIPLNVELLQRSKRITRELSALEYEKRIIRSSGS